MVSVLLWKISSHDAKVNYCKCCGWVWLPAPLPRWQGEGLCIHLVPTYGRVVVQVLKLVWNRKDTSCSRPAFTFQFLQLIGFLSRFGFLRVLSVTSHQTHVIPGVISSHTHVIHSLVLYHTIHMSSIPWCYITPYTCHPFPGVISHHTHVIHSLVLYHPMHMSSIPWCYITPYISLVFDSRHIQIPWCFRLIALECRSLKYKKSLNDEKASGKQTQYWRSKRPQLLIIYVYVHPGGLRRQLIGTTSRSAEALSVATESWAAK